jgi:hypothetical protein
MNEGRRTLKVRKYSQSQWSRFQLVEDRARSAGRVDQGLPSIPLGVYLLGNFRKSRFKRLFAFYNAKTHGYFA